MTNSIHSLEPIDLGNRLRLARERVESTQAAAATAATMSRTTLVAIEQGRRPIKDEELINLADIYGVTLNQLLRREALHVDLVPRFRKMRETMDNAFADAIGILNYFVTAEVEMEDLLGIERQSNLPPERPLLPGDVKKQAETDANELRQRMGLGQGPIRNIFALLELDMGVRLYTHSLKNKISGLFAYDGDVGACVLINANHRYERQVNTIAHEMGHILSSRRRPDVCHDAFHHNSREERYAVAFASALLIPAQTLMRKLQEIRAGSTRLTRRHVIILADYFGVSREGLVRRIEDTKLAPEGTWDWFLRNGGITDVQAAEVLNNRATTDVSALPSPMGTSVRLDTLAAQILDRNLLSEEQIVELLRIDRFKARRLRMEGEDREYDTR